MATKHDLDDWVYEALKALGGRANIPSIGKHIWDHHEADLRASGDLFYTWQYEMRWAGQRLFKAGRMKHKGTSGRGFWELPGH
jgi:hypothetical protein